MVDTNEVKGKVAKGSTGLFASVEGVVQIVLNESIIGYIETSSEPAAMLVALLVFLAGAGALMATAQVRDAR